ncbi:MAG TPA: hypothetical protein VFO10_18445 [Oligoflexus sp.]|uniref:hypothetical protein n=1 Tax=Oligoflexus sp. TaxID=1971216 RepID=UPI002D7EA17C|nr:hypothetical protein [Oligoflexus sp.]HET9239246.1 hypothetical protein [Oligoflexus sp.]
MKKSSIVVTAIIAALITVATIHYRQPVPTPVMTAIAPNPPEKAHHAESQALPANGPLPEHGLSESWLTSYKPLDSGERGEADLVVEQIRKYFIAGKMDADKANEFRGLVYKYQDRLLAHAGRVIVFESADLARSKDGADTVISLVDTLAYFAKNASDWPLALEIIEDIATRPVDFSPSASEQTKSQSNITMQVFEQFARFRPDAAAEFISTSVEKSRREPYLYFYKTGLILAGRTREEISQKLGRLM